MKSIYLYKVVHMVKMGLFTETYVSMAESLKGVDVIHKRKYCFIQQGHC